MKAFRYDFTIKELCYYLFAKKSCPVCGSKMKKIKGYEIVDGAIFNEALTPLYIKGSKEVKYYQYLYECPKCNSQYKLKELADAVK